MYTNLITANMVIIILCLNDKKTSQRTKTKQANKAIQSLKDTLLNTYNSYQ